MLNPWKTLQIKAIYDNPWINLTHHEVLNPAGNPGIYGVVHFKNLAIGIVPIDEAGNTWLVGQYRYTLEEYSWEIPEGGCPLGTEPLASAKRELLEETGIEAKEWQLILETTISNSVTDERGFVYVAKDLTFGTAAPEETEELQVRKLPLSEAIQMVMQGEITDSLSIMALLKTKIFLESGAI